MTDPITTLRRSQDRADHREGIPMVLALVREVGEVTAVTDPVALAEGARIAAAVDALRAELAPEQRDEDMGVVLTLLRAVSYEDFAE